MRNRWGKYQYEPDWRDLENAEAPPANIEDWLLTTDSLTQRVQSCCGKGFHLEILQHGWTRPQLNERRLLLMPDSAYALRREVVLCCSGTPLIFARTIIPNASLQGSGLRLSRLGRKPLGELLFRDHSVERSQWQLTHVAQDNPMFDDVGLAKKKSKSQVWGRRSVFFYANEPLLVAEMFLPAIQKL